MSQQKPFLNTVFNKIKLRLGAIHKNGRFQKSVNAYFAVFYGKPVDNSRYFFSAVYFLIIQNKAERIIGTQELYGIAPLKIEQEMLMINIHCGAVDNHAVIKSFDEGNKSFNRSVKLRFRIVVRQENIRNALPLNIIYEQRLQICGNGNGILGKHFFPHSRCVFIYIISIAFLTRCAARAAQIQIFGT